MKGILLAILAWFSKVGAWILEGLKFIGRKVKSFFKRFTISAGWGNGFDFILLGLKIMTKESFDVILVFELTFLKAHVSIYFEKQL